MPETGPQKTATAATQIPANPQPIGAFPGTLEALAGANDAKGCAEQLAKVAAEFSRVEEFMRSEGITD